MVTEEMRERAKTIEREKERDGLIWRESEKKERQRRNKPCYRSRSRA